MSVKSSIQVCIKLRPCEPGQTTLWQVKDNNAIQLIDSQSDQCVFDYVFDEESKNQMVFDRMAKHIIESCMKGFNGTIFAYGQTSSGKTYTMMGDEKNPGVMVLAAQEIFKQIAKNKDRDYLLRVGYIEIYNEKIYDLLNKKNQDLKIHESNGMVNVNCEECIITSEEDLLQFLCMGNKERTTGETNMNERSSRSHAIFRIIIESRKTNRSDDDAVIQSLLNLVDLAGSERANQTGASGTRLKEGGHINKSLHFLSNVIKSLAENEENKYVSFRDSKLTRILQASLGGNAFTSIICSIKPSIMEESQSTLNFAMRAKKIRLKPQKNEIVSDATMMKRLEREIKELKDRLTEEQRKNESQIKVKLLEQRIKTDTLKIITSNTLLDKLKKNRRRTWCPAASEPEIGHAPDDKLSDPNSNVSNAQLKRSNLPKPSFYPSTSHMSQRPFNVAPKTINIMKSMDMTNNLFTPSCNFDFGELPSATVSGRNLPPLMLSPCVAQLGAEGKQMIERDLAELITFTKLEKHIEADWETLNEQMTTSTAQIDELQSERSSLMDRSEALQAQVDALTQSKQAADIKIEEYVEQLKTLKQTVERLEMENRHAVDLEFQYESHKSKSKRRENELLSTITARNTEIDHLQKSLEELSKDVLRNSKEMHMLSMCPEIESNCERICNKCVELERLLQEYNNMAKPNNETTQAIDCETEQLRAEIAKTRAQLESVQNGYKQMTSDVAEKSDLCERLSRDVISAEEAKGMLQDKYDELEKTQQRHEQVVKGMQADYESIKQKYEKLQHDYNVLERTTTATEEQHKRLQSENESLLLEISTLKKSIFHIQEKLMESTAAEGIEELVQQLKARNHQLTENLTQVEAKFGEMQREYDDLSNQLMESVQDGDSLRDQCSELREQLMQQQAATNGIDLKTQQLLAQIAQLESEVVEKNKLIDDAEGTINEMRENMLKLESTLLEKSVIVSQVEDYQRQIADLTVVCGELQEKVKETTINDSHSSTRTLLTNDSDQESETDILKDRLSDMNVKVDELQTEIKRQLLQIEQKDKLIANMQSELQDLHERCMSMGVQQMQLQTNADQNQELLDRQAEKLAGDAGLIDQLQASNAQLAECNIKAAESFNFSRMEYEKRLKELQIELDNAQQEYELKEKQTKDELDNVKLEYLEKLEFSETGYRENLRKYNIEWQEGKDSYESSLDRLQKQLILSEERCSKLIAESEAELLTVKATNDLAVNQLVKEKHELESMYDESKKLVQQLKSKLNLNEHQGRSDAEKQRDLVSSADQMVQELQIKCETQMHEYKQLKAEHQLSMNQLKLEKSLLQTAVDESTLAIERLTSELYAEKSERKDQAKKLQLLDIELTAALKANATENSEFLGKMVTINSKMTELQEELSQTKLKAIEFDKIFAEHDKLKCLLADATDLNNKLVLKVEKLERELSQAQAELTSQTDNIKKMQSNLEKTLQIKNNACTEQSNLTNKLQILEATLSEQTVQFEHKIQALQSFHVELELKLESLLKQKLELDENNHQLTVKLKNTLNMQKLLEEGRENNAKLAESNAQLQSDLQQQQTTNAQLQSELQQQQTVNSQLQSDLQQQQTDNSQLQSQLQQQQKAISQLQSELQQQQTYTSQQQSEQTASAKLQSELQQQQTTNSQLQSELQQQKITVSQLQSELQQQQKTNSKLQSELKQQQKENSQYENRLAMNVGAANKLNSQIEKLHAEISNLRATLKTNKADRKRLDDTISSLLVDKRNLEERLETTDDIVKKLEKDLRTKANGSNVSFESNASSTSPVARKSLEREINQPRKSVSMGTDVRRNRRISTHDERRQSYWNDSRHVACMTDPVDSNCNCKELDVKLQNCQRELFITECKVTALNIELKNHPLKEENAQLKKRLQDDHAKTRDEIKRFKHKNQDLLSKLNAYTASADISAKNQKATSVETNQATVATQTESDVETDLKKMTAKLTDSLQICRHRYNTIKDLEEKLKQNENSDTSNISSQTAGQINALKSQLELQKKEIHTLTEKYQKAKQVLKYRRDEVVELRKIADTAPTK